MRIRNEFKYLLMNSFLMKEKSRALYFCPRCKSVNIWELDDYIYCPICLLTYEKQSIQQFLEDVLSIEEKK